MTQHVPRFDCQTAVDEDVFSVLADLPGESVLRATLSGWIPCHEEVTLKPRAPLKSASSMDAEGTKWPRIFSTREGEAPPGILDG